MSRLAGIVVLLTAMVTPALATESTSSSEPETGTTQSEVVGGSVVPAGKWPDAVAVLGEGSCTGTLIAPNVVLTAGHCADMNPTRVVANTTNYNAPGGLAVAVKSITAYPSWDTSYDVAVIVLATPITGITPRKLGTPCTFEGFAKDTMVHLVGFGLTDQDGLGNNSQLHEAMAPVLDPECSGPGGCVPAIRPGGEFIAGGSGTDSCFGDSGGPVYLDTAGGPVVIGAVSRGLNNSATPCGGGGIYVRTDKLVQWIETTTGTTVEKDACDVTTPPGEGGGGEAGDEDGKRELDGGDFTGGCSTSPGPAAGAGLAGLLAMWIRRRRR